MTVRLLMALGVAGLAVAAGGCMAKPADGAAAQTAAAPAAGGRYAAGHFRAMAMLKTATGAPAGMAMAEEVSGNLKVTVSVEGLPAGTHGAHVHAVGKCDAPDFTTAGGHWNPTQHQHGSKNPQGPHMGDLPNLVVGADGKGAVDYTIPNATIEGLLDQDGAALVVHAGPDDLMTDPSGNSGGRIACGVFAAM
jgi:superoxide dismutase, Cu-Zn family